LLGFFLVVLLDLLHFDHRREQLADVVGQLGIAVNVLLQGRPLAGAVAGGELIGELGEQNIIGGTVGR
jgi:hypothetical protein